MFDAGRMRSLLSRSNRTSSSVERNDLQAWSRRHEDRVGKDLVDIKPKGFDRIRGPSSRPKDRTSGEDDGEYREFNDAVSGQIGSHKVIEWFVRSVADFRNISRSQSCTGQMSPEKGLNARNEGAGDFLDCATKKGYYFHRCRYLYGLIGKAVMWVF